jgi:hypothetical protein
MWSFLAVEFLPRFHESTGVSFEAIVPKWQIFEEH